MTPPFVPASAPLPRVARLLVAAMGPAGFALRALPGRFGVAARWDDARDALEDEEAFATPYAGIEGKLVGGDGLFTLGLSGRAHRDLRGRLERALNFDAAAAGIAGAARARVAAGVTACAGGHPVEFVGLAHAATAQALRGWLGLAGGGVEDAQLGQWAMTLFEWQFSELGADAARMAGAMAGAMRAFVDGRLAEARAGGGEGLAGALVAAKVPDAQTRAWIVGVAVAALPQLPMAAARALNQLLARPLALAGARRAIREAAPPERPAEGEVALWPFIQEALRFDPVAPALRRVVSAPPRAGRFAGLRPGAQVRVLLKSAMRDGRRVPRPGVFDPRRDPSAWLGFGAGPHACIAQALARAVLPAMLAPLVAPKPGAGAPRRIGAMRGDGLAPTRLLVGFDP
jgi:cytochrome P450